MNKKVIFALLISASLISTSCSTTDESIINKIDIEQVFENIETNIGTPKYKYPTKLELDLIIDDVNYKSRLSLEDLYSYTFKEGKYNDKPCTLKHWEYVLEKETLYKVDLVDFDDINEKDIRVYTKESFIDNSSFVDNVKSHIKLIHQVLDAGKDLVLSYDYPIIEDDNSETKISINTNKKMNLDFKAFKKKDECKTLIGSLLIQDCFPKEGFYRNLNKTIKANKFYFKFSYNFVNIQKPNVIDFEEIKK